jgi:restriction system protein
MKHEALLDLAKQRQTSRLDGYGSVGDFHGGIFECDHVSPWTKSGSNVNARIMVVGQDWSSSDALNNPTEVQQRAKFGFSPTFPTNANLDGLLERHFGLRRSDCYLTNLFPYVKHGGPSANIPLKDLVACAKRFTLPEIEIISPKIVLCLGRITFVALRRAVGIKGNPKMDEAVRSPVGYREATIHCVAHTGSFGMNNRGREQVETDWKQIATSSKTHKI